MPFAHFGAADLNQVISNISLTVVFWGSITLVILVALSIALINKMPKTKLPLFTLILLVVGGTTLTIAGGTIYLNIKSAAGGPVHWHADFEMWACNNELELRDPQGLLSNKIGTPTLHEHNDKRIHLEGVPITLPHDASLGHFMQTVGGGLSKNSLTVPLNDSGYFASGKSKEDGDGPAMTAPEDLNPYIKTEASGKVASFVSGQKCGDQPAEVQVFAYNYNTKTKTYAQRKLTDPANYVISPQENIPPGDCIIMEFAPRTATTNKLCKQYGVKDATRCGDFGVPANKQADVCDSREIAPASCQGKPNEGISYECNQLLNHAEGT